MDDLPLVQYPPVILDAVAYTHAGDFELATKVLEQLDATLTVAQLTAMYAELVVRYERKCGFEPGTVVPRLRAHYEACESLKVSANPPPPPPRKNRRVNR